MDTLHDAMWLFIVVPFISFVGGSCSAFSLRVFDLVQWDRLLFVWPTWVLGDLSAILCVAPCVLHLWNIFHPDMLPIWGVSANSRVRAELSQVDEATQHSVESDDGRRPSNVVEGKMQAGAARHRDTGVQLLPWNGSERFEGHDDTDMENAVMKDGSPVAKRNISLKERFELWKGRWNKWVLDRRRKLCVGGERSGSLLEERILSSTDNVLVYENSLPRSS